MVAPRRLAIDWSAVKLASDADARALWERIAPTGDDWLLKLDEIPAAIAKPLATALLREGNFTCMTPAPARDCVRRVVAVDPPRPDATHRDPCLRRVLALWALDQIGGDEVVAMLPTLRSIVTIPPPESELVEAVLERVPQAQQQTLLELYAIAYHAGHRDIVNPLVGRLEQPQLEQAVTKHHIDGALEVLSAEGHRAVYLAAVTDEQLATKARVEAIVELVALHDTLPADLKGLLRKVVRSPDCGVAAAAARALARRGEPRFVPRRPRTLQPAAMMRAICVLASYEALQEADETSLLAGFLLPKGLERVDIAYDPPADHEPEVAPRPPAPAVDLVPRAEAVLPELEDMVRALRSCQGTVCVSDDRIFSFVLKPVGGQLFLQRLEIAERPRCRAATP